ncbi:MAG: TolC family protein [Ignavibacteriota bacterium]
MKAAEARFNQARALIKVSQSQKYPTVTAGVSITGNRDSSTYALATSKTSSAFGNYQLPVDVSYEVDAWGRVRHSIEAAREEAQATAADLETLPSQLSRRAGLRLFRTAQRRGRTALAGRYRTDFSKGSRPDAKPL